MTKDHKQDVRSKLEELKLAGENGMKPCYDDWLTFHDKVALIAEQALTSLQHLVDGDELVRRLEEKKRDFHGGDFVTMQEADELIGRNSAIDQAITIIEEMRNV